MQKKKTNKLKNTVKKSSIKASTVKDPITTPIIKKEKEINKDIEQKFVPFFQDSNNIYPNDLAKRARRSSTHSSIINQKIAFTIGKGFLYSKDGEDVDFKDLPKDFQEWLMEVNPENDTIDTLFKQLVQNYVITGQCYPHVKKSGNYTAIFSEDATTVRKGKDKKRAYISNFWRDILLNYAPVSDYPINSSLTFWNGTPKNEYLVHIMRKYPEFSYYGLPDYAGALDWIDIEYRISKYNIDKFDNGFFPSVLMQMFGEVPDGMNAQAYVQEIKKRYTGEGNNDKFLVELLDSPEQAAKVIEFERERDGEFQMLSELAIRNIITAHRITPSLAGLETSGKLGSNQQIKLEYDKFMNSVIIPDFQEPILRALNNIIKRETKFGDYKLSILNVSPVGNSDRVELNAVTTVNEGRLMIGLQPFEEGDVRGELFINQNAVANIETEVTNEEIEE